MKPNLVVGLVGLVVFLVTGSLIVSGFRDLTGIRTYQTDFESFSVHLPQRSNTLGPGPASRNEVFSVTHHNLTSALVRLTWEESLARTHDVTVVVTNAKSEVVGQTTGRGGASGLTVDHDVRPMPSGERFSEVSNRIEAEFYERYGDYTEDVGGWTVQISSKGPGGVTDTGISYTVSFDYEYWVGTYTQVAELVK